MIIRNNWTQEYSKDFIEQINILYKIFYKKELFDVFVPKNDLKIRLLRHSNIQFYGNYGRICMIFCIMQ